MSKIRDSHKPLYQVGDPKWKGRNRNLRYPPHWRWELEKGQLVAVDAVKVALKESKAKLANVVSLRIYLIFLFSKYSFILCLKAPALSRVQKLSLGQVHTHQLPPQVFPHILFILQLTQTDVRTPRRQFCLASKDGVELIAYAL